MPARCKEQEKKMKDGKINGKSDKKYKETAQRRRKTESSSRQEKSSEITRQELTNKTTGCELTPSVQGMVRWEWRDVTTSCEQLASGQQQHICIMCSSCFFCNLVENDFVHNSTYETRSYEAWTCDLCPSPRWHASRTDSASYLHSWSHSAPCRTSLKWLHSQRQGHLVRYHISRGTGIDSYPEFFIRAKCADLTVNLKVLHVQILIPGLPGPPRCHSRPCCSSPSTPCSKPGKIASFPKNKKGNGTTTPLHMYINGWLFHEPKVRR